MFTSCGWFFDELSALEPVQILRYAAMALQYLADLGGPRLEEEFVRRLAAAPTNVPAYPDGAAVWKRLIRPAVVDLRRVIAHYAITGLIDERPDDDAVYAYRVQRIDEAREAYGGTALRVGHVRASSTVTGEVRDATYAVLHFGGHDFSCGIRGYEDPESYEVTKADLLRRYAQHSMADMVRGLDEYFPRDLFSLTHLFIEERRRVLANVIQAVLARHEETYHRIWDESRKLVRYLRQAEAPIPEVFRITGKHVLEEELNAELHRTAETLALTERAVDLAAEARALGLALDLRPARPLMRRAVAAALEAVADSPTAARIATATALVTGAQRIGVRFSLWRTQNEFFALWQRHPKARPALRPLAEALGFDLAIETP
jgi:hypothetical protein